MKRISKLWLIIMIVLAAMPTYAFGATAAADDATSDSVRFEWNTVESNNQLEVTVEAFQVTDVYAFELRFSFDALRWRLKNSIIDHRGFPVPPIVEDGFLRIAHTQMGQSAGKNGNLTLARLSFERIRSGDSALELETVRLVNSDIEGKNYEPGLRVELKDSDSATIQLNDIEGHWAEEVIREAVDLGFVAGYDDGTFRPQNPITRAEFTVMLSRALLLPEHSETVLKFEDEDSIPGWARQYVASAVGAGLVKGYDDGTFRPDERITRLEMAALVVRSLDIATVDSSISAFSDYDQIPAWGRPIADAAADSGLMQGKDNRRFAPQDNASRAEVVTVIMNALHWE